MMAKLKSVNYQLIDREDFAGYPIMDSLVIKHHPHLTDAKIALAWAHGWKENADGITQLAKCKRATDLDRELHEYDFVICLNYEVWNSVDFSPGQMAALLDHELCHAQVSRDSDGQPKQDERGRAVYRIRKHDIEEFHDVVARHGGHTDEIRRFAEAIIADQQYPILKAEKKQRA